MRRFTLATAGYAVICVVLAIAIVLRGDGPHPRIIGLIPPSGDRFFPGGAVEITFSQPMDTSSVERSLQVSPGGQGQGAWYGNTLNIQPLADWRPGTTYHVSLRGSVTDDEGRPMRTPVSFWFHVHHISRLAFCRVRGVRNLCDTSPGYHHPITNSSQPVLTYTRSDDGTLIAFTHRDSSGQPHLFLLDVTTETVSQLTHSRRFADSNPFFAQSDTTMVGYSRRPITGTGNHTRVGKKQLWSVLTDGSANSKIGG